VGLVSGGVGFCQSCTLSCFVKLNSISMGPALSLVVVYSFLFRLGVRPKNEVADSVNDRVVSTTLLQEHLPVAQGNKLSAHETRAAKPEAT
jgi:hypothetical protein